MQGRLFKERKESTDPHDMWERRKGSRPGLRAKPWGLKTCPGPDESTHPSGPGLARIKQEHQGHSCTLNPEKKENTGGSQ